MPTLYSNHLYVTGRRDPPVNAMANTKEHAALVRMTARLRCAAPTPMLRDPR